MMGHTHALCGALAGLAVAVTLPEAHSAVIAPVFAAVGAGAALMPDLDHPSSTAARSLGPLSGGIASVVRFVSGGHRKGTHSILGTAVATAIFAVLVAGLPTLLAPHTAGRAAWALAVSLVGPVVAGFVAAIGVGAVVGGRVGTLLALAAGAAVGFGAHASAGPLAWQGLVVVFAAGYLAHLAGDMFTKEGVPLAWPAGGNIRLAMLTTGSFTETRLLVPLLTVAVLAGLGWIYWPAAASLVG